MNPEKSRAEMEADIARFQKEYLRLISKKQVKREIIRLLKKEKEEGLNLYDIGMELETPLKAVISAVLELESQKRIQPITDVLRRGEISELPIKLNPHAKSKSNRVGQPRRDVKELLTLLESNCFLFESGRMHAYQIMLSNNDPTFRGTA